MLPHSLTSSGCTGARLSKVGNGNLFEIAFLDDDVADRHGGVAEIAVPEKIDHVVKVAWPRTLRERPHLLAEQFLEGIAAGRDAVRRRIGIGMRGRGNH
jgi:hypothetical protein